ncbi:PP2C family protein-serine/threonine phosphatase [Streptomyces daliensis]
MGTGRAVVHLRAPKWPPAWFGLLPPVLIVLAVTLEEAAPPKYFFGSLLSAAVLLAALLYRPLGTAAMGALCVLVLAALDISQGSAYDPHIVGSLVTLLVVAGLVTLLSVARERTVRQLTQVRAVAQAAQLALLRPLPERIGPVRVAGFYRAADDEALIGGDLYSVRQTPYGVRVLVGDVRGKGIGATGTVATIMASFREAAVTCEDLAEVAGRIEMAMALDREDATPPGGAGPPGDGALPQDTGPDDELFATAVLMEFPGDAEEVRVLDRGHPPLLRLAPDGATPLTATPGLPLGLGDLSEGTERAEGFPMPVGDMLVAYSDGVTEARGRDGAFYPLRQRLNDHFCRPADEPGGSGGSGCFEGRGTVPAEIVTFLQDDVARWAPTIGDDMVVVVLRRLPSADSPGPPGTPEPTATY